MSEHLTLSDWIQIGIAVITSIAVIVALFGKRFWDLFDRPKIKISFDKSSDRCFRWAIIKNNHIQDEGVHENVKKQYFRLRVTNKGGLAKGLRVRADIFDKSGKELERFEPSTLRWINGKEEVDLAVGESEFVNFLSQVLESDRKINNRLTIEVFDASPRGIAWDRLLMEYHFQITVYGENIKPKSFKAVFKPNQTKSKPGDLSFG